jgi:hypothetical protein
MISEGGVEVVLMDCSENDEVEEGAPGDESCEKSIGGAVYCGSPDILD